MGKEFDLLAFLAARPGHVFSRAELLRAVWQSTPEWQQAATVTEHIRRLRVKIEVDSSHPRILRTVRGSGYRLDLPGTDAPDGHRGDLFEPGTIIHLAGRIVHADPAAGTLLGPTSEAELVGRQIFELAAPASRRATRERMAFTGPGPSRRTQLIDLERTDGTAVSVEVASEQTSWENQPAGQVTLTHVPDLSAWLRRLVTGVLSEVTDAVIITDLHFHVRSWNHAAERLYGWREHEVLGRHLLDILQPRGDGDDDAALDATWEDLENTGRWKGEGRHLARDGTATNVLSCITLIQDHSGEPTLVVAVNRPAPSVASAQEMADLYDDDQIRMGLANDEFVVHYQPVIDLTHDRVIGMEALVRWNHPDRGLLAPDGFIAAAERSGAIIELGNVVFEKACAQAAEWQRSGENFTLSVNLSARQLADPKLYERIITVLAFTGLEPDHLWLEVTETALIDDVDRASTVLHRLTDLGIGITIDDFGTGWASLTYLRSFPIHALKIDRSFVAGVAMTANDTAIVRSILALGAELGLAVVAEGIETRAQQHALEKLGCTIGQGFLYGRPGPAPDTRTSLPGLSAPSSLPAASAAHPSDGDRSPVQPTLGPAIPPATVEVFTGQEVTPQELLPPDPDLQPRAAPRRPPISSEQPAVSDAADEYDLVANLLGETERPEDEKTPRRPLEPAAVGSPISRTRRELALLGLDFGPSGRHRLGVRSVQRHERSELVDHRRGHRALPLHRVCSGVERRCAITGCGRSADDDDAGGGVPLAEVTDDRSAARPPKVEIDEHQIGLRGGDQSEGTRRIACFSHDFESAVELDHRGQKEPDVRTIINDHHPDPGRTDGRL